MLDHVFGAPKEASKPDWTLGGTTTMVLSINHRISHDIDIFLHGESLKAFTPAHNSKAALISRQFQWPGYTLRFERPDSEIGFFSARLLTEPGFIWQPFAERSITVEMPDEVIVKIIRYRPERFTAVDTFDLAAVAMTRPGLDKVLAAEVADTLRRLTESLRVLRVKRPAAVATAVVPFREFGDLPDSAIPVVTINQAPKYAALRLPASTIAHVAGPWFPKASALDTGRAAACDGEHGAWRATSTCWIEVAMARDKEGVLVVTPQRQRR